MKLSSILSILLITAISVMAQQADFNQTKMSYGEDIVFQSARMLGLGGSGVAGGDVGTALAMNPALLRASDEMIQFQFGMQLNKITEDRAFPYYDSFVGFNDYGSYSFNTHWYGRFYGALVFNLPLPVMKRFSFGLGYLPFKDMQYDYREEIRTPTEKNDAFWGYNSVVQNGVLDQFSLSAAYEPIDDLSVGLQLGILSGEVDSVMSISPQADEADPVREQLTKELDGVPFLATLGVQYKYDERLSIGMSMRLPYTIKFKNTYDHVTIDTTTNGSYSQSLSYPMRLGSGLEYRFENILAARLSFDFVYEFWSAFEDDRRDTDFQDTYTIHTGVEHLFFDNIPFRVGFLYGTLRESKGFSRTVLTIGSGFELNNLKVDFAGGLSSMEYYQQDYFPDSIYGLGDRSDSDRVNLKQYFVRIDLNYSWNGAK